MSAGARHLIAHSGSQGLSLCAPFPFSQACRPIHHPPIFTTNPTVYPAACRFAPRRRRSCATQPAGRVGGPARVEFSPQAGQPNGNKKLRQTALPTPRRPVYIAALRERDRVDESGAHNWPTVLVKGASATLQGVVQLLQG